jgi:HlyD family secretion protein
MTQGWTLLTLTLLLVLALPLSGCAGVAESAQTEPSAPGAGAGLALEEAATPVQVEPVQTGDISVVYAYTGDIQAADSVNVMPAAAGRVESVLVGVGDELKAGDPIAVVDSAVYAAQLKQAEANLELAELGLRKMEEGTRPEQIAVAQAAVQFARNAVNDLTDISDEERTAAVAALAQAEAGLRLAQSEYDKIAWAGQVGMMPQALQLEQATIAYEAAKAAYDLQTNPSDLQLSPLMIQLAQAELALALAKNPFTETDFEMARNQVELAEAAVEMARIQLNETTIRAPFDGMVAELYISEGSMAAPQAPAALFLSQEMQVVIDVEESRIGQVQEGQNAALQVATYPGQDFPAVVTSVAPAADKDSHTFAVEVTPLDEDGLLRSGMYANISLLVEERQATLLVPQAAVAEVNGKPSVFVVNGDSIAEQRPVTTGLADDGHIEILSGLAAEELVVVAGQSTLVDGAKVEIRK